MAHDWSPDGRFIVFASASQDTKFDLWLYSLAEQRTIPYLQTPFNELQGHVSPDGRWIAYTSDESGGWEVYIQSFPTPGQRRRISTRGGAQTRWRKDGKELFYLQPDGTLTSAAVDLGTKNGIEVGTPERLFPTQARSAVFPSWSEFAVASDGQRFLIVEHEQVDPSITVVLNWTAETRP